MSRFENLEFGREKTQQSTAEIPSKPLLKDENHFLGEALANFEKGRFEQALRAYSKVLEFNPQSAPAWFGQVRMLIELGEYNEAKIWADKALGLFPDDAELLAAKGVALARMGDLSGALSFSDAAVETRGNTPYIWLARADVLLARKEKRADYCLQKAIDIASNNWFVLWLASRIESYYQRFARSLKLAQEAMALDSTRTVVWLQSAQCQLALGLSAQASRSIEQARELDPDCKVEPFSSQVGRPAFLDKVAARWRQWFQK